MTDDEWRLIVTGVAMIAWALAALAWVGVMLERRAQAQWDGPDLDGWLRSLSNN